MPADLFPVRMGILLKEEAGETPYTGGAQRPRFWSQLCHKQTLRSFHWDHRVHVGKHERTELEVGAETGSLGAKRGSQM